MTVITKSASSSYETKNLADLQDCQWTRTSRDVIRSSPPPKSKASRIHTSFWRMVSLLEDAGKLDGDCDCENKMSPHGGNFKRSPVRAKISNPCTKSESYLRRCGEFLHQNAEGDTQLHIAVVQELPMTVEAMVKAAPYPGLLDVKNDDSQTPLHVAVLTGQPGVVRCLLEGGANPAKRDRLGNTALHLACQEGDLGCVKELTSPRHGKALAKQRKPPKALADPRHTSCTNKLAQLGPDNQVPNSYQSMDVTCMNGEKSMLFESNPGYYPPFSRTTFSVEEGSSVMTVSNGFPAAVGEDQGVRVAEDEELAVRNFEGETCAHVAAIHGHVAVLRWLALCGVDLNARDGKSGNTLLHAALERRLDAVRRFLLEECVDQLEFGTRNYAGLTAFEMAVRVDPLTAGMIASLIDTRTARQAIRE